MKKRIRNLPIREIFTAVKKHPAGASLKKIERYDNFREGESVKVWREVLGASANTLEHSELFTGIVLSLIKEEGDRYSMEERRKLVLGAVVHDFGEAFINGDGVGDIAWYLKTDETDKKEAEIAHRVISGLDVPDELKEDLHTIYKEVVEGENEKLHLAFKALEKTEYFMTAMKVYQNCRKREGEGKKIIKNEKDMVGKIIVNNLQNNLEVYVEEFPNSIGKYIERMIPVVDEAYAFTKPHLQSLEEYREKTKIFEKTWAEFKENLPSS